MIKALIAASLGVGEIILIVACALIVVGAIVTAIIPKVNRPAEEIAVAVPANFASCTTRPKLKNKQKQNVSPSILCF